MQLIKTNMLVSTLISNQMDAAAADKAWIPAQPLPSNASYFGMTAFRSADGKPKAMIATGKVFGFGVPPQVNGVTYFKKLFRLKKQT